MKTRARKLRTLGGAAVLAVALSACATPIAQQAHVAVPAPCADSTYVQLKQQHPDSLSDRAWQRLQALDRDCAAARTEAHHATSATHGMGHGAIGMGIIGVLMMAAMAIGMW